MKRCLACGAVLLLALSCSQEGLRTGDLLFQAGESDFSGAIEAVTDGNWSHVGIVDRTGKGILILEAEPSGGVVRRPLRAFLEEAAVLEDGSRAVQAFRVDSLTDVLRGKAVRRADSLLGRPYDFAFLPGTEAVYCSELVYECFRREDGAPLFEARPMTFKDTRGETVPYWIDYYGKLGCDIPEGVPGTNPNDLSRDPHLIPLNWKP